MDTANSFMHTPQHMKRWVYTDLPRDERAAFERACLRHGFAPMHFLVTLTRDEASAQWQVTLYRAGWTQSYRTGGQWIRQFEQDLVRRLFK